MPKIIENVRESLLREARNQVLDHGYTAMTIRSVARACHVAPGTVYNYFPSKLILTASFLLEDWRHNLKRLTEGSAETPEEILSEMYQVLCNFMGQYASLFRDETAVGEFTKAVSQYHVLLRDQLALPLLPFCERQQKADAEFLAEFAAEAMLTWVVEGRTLDEINAILLQLF